jgi:hypothetical protein
MSPLGTVNLGPTCISDWFIMNIPGVATTSGACRRFVALSLYLIQRRQAPLVVATRTRFVDYYCALPPNSSAF